MTQSFSPMTRVKQYALDHPEGFTASEARQALHLTDAAGMLSALHRRAQVRREGKPGHYTYYPTSEMTV